MVLLKNWPFFGTYFFLDNISQENVFYDILERNNAFLGNKNNQFKKSKYCHFSKRVNPWFCSKTGHFCLFCFQAIQAKKMCFIIFQNEKTHFQVLKRGILKSGKIDIFPKGLTHGFARKMVIFPSYFFQTIQARKTCFMIFQNEKTHFQAIKTRSSKSRKIDIFPKGLTHGFAQKLVIFPTFFFQTIQTSKMCFLIF